MKRKLSTGLLGYLILSVWMHSSLFAQSKKRKPAPNIIILFCDDMGYGDVGVYGHPTIKTPNIDRMSQEGMKFTSFYTGSPACTASRYSLLTGRYPVMSGFGWVLYPKSERGIHPKEHTLAEALKEKGYTTAMFGKWHLGSTKKEYLPRQNGFDEYVGLPYSNDMLPPKWPDIPLLQGNDTLELNPDQTKLTELYTQKAIEFIRNHKQDPFFIYLPYAMPHVPLHPGKKFAGKSRRGTYGDVVEEVDWSVGQILETLRKNGLDKNTLVWFTSDNGPWLIKGADGGSAGLLRDGKGSTWEGGMRVPSVAWWPGQIEEQSVNGELTSTIDLYPTLLSLVGGTVPTDRLMDGKDIAAYLFPKKNRNVTTKPFFYYGFNQTIFAVRKGPWKLHIRTHSQLKVDYFNKELPLLFNLEEDPSEKYNLAKQHPEIVNELLKEIEAQQQRVAGNPDFYTLSAH
ncbi:sulfatase [Rapidithrix thailandica]|uniref:Sulfatase n=1 Tax=Rapidithrix thailandica TaxID=413964 RepID=A0AAW9S074_9BACT